MPNLVNTDIPLANFILMPMFIVRAIDIEKYTEGVISTFRVRPVEDNYKLIPIVNGKPKIDQYVYIDSTYNMIVHSPNFTADRTITFDAKGNVNTSSITPIEIADMALFTVNLTGPKNIKLMLKQ